MLHAIAISVNAERLLVKTGLAGLAVNVGLNLYVIPRMGANGAALATVVGEFVSMGVLVTGLWRASATAAAILKAAMKDRRQQRSCIRVIFVLLFASYAYFYEAGGWNQNSRFALVRAITNEHSVRIDPFQKATGDKAFFEGHYYSDKAPGLALTAVPIVAVARPFMALGGDDPESYGGIAFLSYLSTVLTVGLLTAAAGVSLFHVCTELGATRTAALFAALSFGLATPIWALATLFIGHALSAACLVFAFTAAVRIGRADESADRRLGAIVGLGAGWATVSEFPAAVPAVLLAGLAVVHAWPLGRARAVRVLGALAGGALACAAVLMAFQYVCFGSPFHLAYSSEQGYESMRQGVFGIGVPRMMRLRQILFSVSTAVCCHWRPSSPSPRLAWRSCSSKALAPAGRRWSPERSASITSCSTRATPIGRADGRTAPGT